MKKNIIRALLVCTLVFSCTGCNSKKENTSDSEKTTEITEIPEESAEPSTESIKEEVSETSEELTASETTEAPEENTEVVEIVENEVPSYTFSDLSKTMYATQTVNIRNLPSTDGNKLGGLTANQEVAVTGKCNETGWYRISFENGEAFISDDYLSEGKVEVAQQASTDTSGEAASNNCPYPLWTPFDDMGDSASWYVVQPDTSHCGTENDPFVILKARIDESRIGNGHTCTIEQIEWTYMGKYAEGNVYKQTFKLHYFIYGDENSYHENWPY